MKMHKYLWVLLLGLVTLAGCGLDNTMYNARKAFESAQSKPLTATGKSSSDANTDYDKTIKKCGIILTERKNSPEADDALFLMAESYFYKGNNQFVAKDLFLSLIKNFPDSPFVPESSIFIAQIDRQINQPQEAAAVLEAFSRDPATLKYHARALFVLADFAIQDKDYIKAQYWLDKILTEYPKTKEFKEAFFLSGKLWYEQKDFTKSLEQFQKLTKAKRIDKTIVLDARYYIALNQLLLGDTKTALITIKKLLSEEYRVDKIPLCSVLKGRIWLAMGKEKEGKALLNDIIKTSARSLASAEAYYWLGEYDFLQKKDVPAAVEDFSKSKGEAAASPFTAPATARYNAVNLIKTTAALKPGTDTQAYLDNNLVIAENYFTLFELPDSVFSVFRQIEATPALIKVYEDSLTVKVDSLTLAIDSLAAIVDTTEATTAAPAGTEQKELKNEVILPETKQVPSEADSLFTRGLTPIDKPDTVRVEPPLQDSLEIKSPKTVQDSLDIVNIKEGKDSEQPVVPEPESLKEPLTAADSLAIVREKAVADSLAAVKLQNHQRFDNMRTQKTQYLDQIKAMKEASKTFVEQQIPYALFVKASMVKRGLADSTMLVTIYQDMQTRYPDNKYTNALRMMLAGETVRLVDPEFDMEENDYDKALGELETVPDSAVVILDTLTKSSYQEISIKSNFRLGWLYAFENIDTTKAKPYLDAVLKLNRTSDYGLLVSRFYTGTQFDIPEVNFAVFDTLLKQMAIQDSITAASLKDSLATKADADSLADKLKTDNPANKPLSEPGTVVNPEGQNEITPIIKPDYTPYITP